MVRRTPSYREAFPRLDIREIQAAVLEHRIACQYTDETGRELGQAFILELADDRIVMGYCLHGPYLEYRAGRVSLTIQHSPDPVNRDRYVFECPNCSLPKKTLFFNGPWSCADCLGLIFRSQLVRPDVRDFERICARRDELRAILAKGRPHRMRHKSFAKLQSELKSHRGWLASNPRRVASAEHRHIVQGHWMEPQHLPNGLAHEGFTVRGKAIEKEHWFRFPDLLANESSTGS